MTTEEILHSNLNHYDWSQTGAYTRNHLAYAGVMNENLLQNYTGTTMLANSEFVALLKQANTDSSKMAEVIGVSDAQLHSIIRLEKIPVIPLM